ncbi:putative anion transporter 6 [Hibiscus syriacus]|uniref:Anion transporter 6 n=1 Tax=Hibiscus syriacus TaxID=106335 RepID=A0A6A2X1N3_HIBSY|nr:putative anion transporter 6 [Hibiscus syriacus]
MLLGLTNQAKAQYFTHSIMVMLVHRCLEDDPNRVTVLVVACSLVGVAQWVPPHERSRSVSFTTSGMYLGAAVGMLVLPSLLKFRGPQSVFSCTSGIRRHVAFLWFKYATAPLDLSIRKPLPLVLENPCYLPKQNIWWNRFLFFSGSRFLGIWWAGFAVNHMDIAPKYAGIVMGVSNTAGTLAGIIGVDMTRKLLEAVKDEYSDLSSPE